MDKEKTTVLLLQKKNFFPSTLLGAKRVSVTKDRLTKEKLTDLIFSWHRRLHKEMKIQRNG